MSRLTFDRQSWLSRVGATLEHLTSKGRPDNFPVDRTHLPNFGLISLVEGAELRQYRLLAARAKIDLRASDLFEQSSFLLDSVPSDLIDILCEHPLLTRARCRSGRGDRFHFRWLLTSGAGGAEPLAANLVKAAVKFGGSYAATMLDRYLVMGDAGRLHAHEITLLHGLVVEEFVKLGRGGYLAPYNLVKKRFGLPEEPESWIERSGLNPGEWNRSTSLSAFVRSVGWGPGVAFCRCGSDQNSFPPLQYRFPNEYAVKSLDDFFHDYPTLIELLSVAVQTKLVFHTVFHAFPHWMRNLSRNFRIQRIESGAGLFDVWPRDLSMSEDEAAIFVRLARGWRPYAGQRRRAIDLAIHRIGASFVPAAGAFGLEDRILDVAIALESMYGPFDGGEITHKITTRAAWLLGTSPEDRWEIAQDIKSVYKARSDIVHGRTRTDRAEVERVFDLGRQLARRTLIKLLNGSPAPHWEELVVRGTPTGPP